jgi:hypothetical protein
MTEQPRAVPINRHAFQLLQAAGITPPAKADELMDVHEVDAKLLAAGMSTTDRMALKAHLRDARLLTPGRPVNMSRR